MILYKKTDCGCYGDGSTFGTTHIRERLYDLVNSTLKFGNPDLTQLEFGERLLADLDAEPSDDFSEEDNAIDFLQQFTEEGLFWMMHSGDLILTEEEEE